MLNIGQFVYTVCKLYKTKEKFVIYVSKKEIVGINKENDGSITYTAGKYRELNFKEISEGLYQAAKGQRVKTVYLTKQEANAEKEARLKKEMTKKNADVNNSLEDNKNQS